MTFYTESRSHTRGSVRLFAKAAIGFAAVGGMLLGSVAPTLAVDVSAIAADSGVAGGRFSRIVQIPLHDKFLALIDERTGNLDVRSPGLFVPGVHGPVEVGFSYRSEFSKAMKYDRTWKWTGSYIDGTAVYLPYGGGYQVDESGHLIGLQGDEIVFSDLRGLSAVCDPVLPAREGVRNAVPATFCLSYTETGVKEFFNENGSPLATTSVDGHRVDWLYGTGESDTPPGHLAAIIDSEGGRTEMRYTREARGTGSIATVEATAPSGKKTSLTSLINADGRAYLNDVVTPDGRRTGANNTGDMYFRNESEYVRFVVDWKVGRIDGREFSYPGAYRKEAIDGGDYTELWRRTWSVTDGSEGQIIQEDTVTDR